MSIIVLPKVGEKITTNRAIELCQYYKLNYLINRIQKNPELYNEWIFDGVSGLPDRLASILVDCDQHLLTYECALPHDLAYAYGKLNDVNEKKAIDTKFLHDLIYVANANPVMAKVFYLAVNVLGKQELRMPFTWAFANKNV